MSFNADDEMDGSFVVSPGVIKDEINTVDSNIKSLDSSISPSNVPDEFKASWRIFVNEWENFRLEHEGYFSRFPGRVYDKTLEYRKRTDEWLASFVALGGKTYQREMGKPEDKDILKYGLKAALVVGTIYVGYKLIKSIGEDE